MHRLPNYARRVEYLESTGTQWIDSGLTLTPDSRCEISLAADWNPSSTFYLFGPSATNGRFVFGRGYTSGSNATKLYFGLGVQNYVSNVSFDSLGTERHSYFIDAATKTAGVDGTSFSLTSAGELSGTPALCMLCQIQNNRGFMKAKLYTARYWQNGALVRSFVPCRVGSTGNLWDEVTGAFFGNAGTGAFVLGTDIAGGGINASASRPLADGRDAPMTRFAQTMRAGGRRHEKPRPALPARQTVEGRHAA